MSSTLIIYTFQLLKIFTTLDQGVCVKLKQYWTYITLNWQAWGIITRATYFVISPYHGNVLGHHRTMLTRIYCSTVSGVTNQNAIRQPLNCYQSIQHVCVTVAHAMSRLHVAYFGYKNCYNNVTTRACNRCANITAIPTPRGQMES